MHAALAGSLFTTASAPAHAEEYLSPFVFLKQAFDDAMPPAAEMWPSKTLRPRIRAVLGHPYKHLRVVYWRSGGRTAWILDEIGRDEEITIGFVIEDDAIARSEVLVFRESRGWEIRFPSFKRQFRGARLADGDKLDKPIDGITGATLSVGAYQRLARLALMLHQEVIANGSARS